MIEPERIQLLNEEAKTRGEYVLYWMQSSVRADFNHALEFSIKKANELNKPLLIFFGLTSDYPDANWRHYHFLLEGLKQTEASLKNRGLTLLIQKVNPQEGCSKLGQDAALIVTDRGYLPLQRTWKENVSEDVECPCIQIESDVIVPVETTSPKEEYSAGTIRKKIQSQLNYFMRPIEKYQVSKESFDLDFDSLDINDTSKTLKKLKIDKNVMESAYFPGGTAEAQNRLQYFIDNKLDRFHELRNDPSQDYLSHMSPYLHFGQISPLFIALKIKETDSPGKESYLEELIIRRELSMNFVFYNDDFDNFYCLPNWAQKTLLEHAKDPRDYIYSINELEKGKTHDPYWNAAQNEMVLTGKMHGYMRMYWGKKIIEWTENPFQAYHTALYLNNKYEIDGRDPNGYTGVAWCFGKHDRAWKERKIFGKTRYMNDNGLRRKFKIDQYVNKIEQIKTDITDK